MRVLYLTYDGLTDPLGQSQILPYLVGLWRRFGKDLELDIISFEKKARYEQQASALREVLATNSIRWHPQRFHSWPPLLAKAYDQWRFKQVTSRKTREISPTAYHARSYLAGWIAYQISQRTGRPWIFDMRGFWADERRDNGLWPASHPFYRRLYQLWKARERLMLKSATEIVVLTEAAKNTLEGWGIGSDRITVIPCAADFDSFTLSPAERLKVRQTIRKALNIPPEGIVFVYSGSMGSHYAPEDVVEIMTAAYQLRKEVYFLILTIHDTSSLQNNLIDRGFPHSQYRVLSAAHADIPRYLAAADIGIATVKPTFSKVASSFTKLAEYLAADLPVIATAIGDVERLARQIPGIFPYRYTSEIPATVGRLLEFYLREKAELEVPLSALSRPILGLEAALDRYQGIYERILSRSGQ